MRCARLRSAPVSRPRQCARAAHRAGTSWEIALPQYCWPVAARRRQEFELLPEFEPDKRFCRHGAQRLTTSKVSERCRTSAQGMK